MRALPVGGAYTAADLRGPECDRATHVVSRVYLGGFAMVAGESSVIDAAASVFSAKAGASRDASAEHIAREGVAEACEKAQSDGKENSQCAVPLRVGLLAIAGRVEGGCPSGSTFDGKQCVQRQVVTQIDCPPGTKLEGDLPTEDGALVSIPLPNRTTVIDAWSPSCVPCRERVPALVKRAADLEAANAKLVLVAVLAEGESTEQARATLSSWGVSRPFLVDRGDVLRREASVHDLPSTLVISRTGEVLWVAPPTASADDVVKAARSGP